MLTKLTIHNFKGLGHAEIELSQNVIFIGPNNSGKTTALQALALWYVGVEKWKPGFIIPERSDAEFLSFDINRLDVISSPVPSTEMLLTNSGIQNNKVIPIMVKVEGLSEGQSWVLEFHFDYENTESFICRLQDAKSQVKRIKLAPQVVFLPPMSGLVAVEPRVERGRLNVLIGEGRTAEVLRNLCFQLYEQKDSSGNWNKLISHIRHMFGVELLTPVYLPGRGEIRMSYREGNGTTLDLSSSGRGMLQVLLLLAYMYNNPNAVLLLDEPDAHLEIIRQREIYHVVTSVAREQNAQIIAASHSEVILNEAAELDTVVAFIGKPHRMNKRDKSQVSKALKDIRAVDYALAEQTGWILYVEGSTDLAILQTLAHRLGHGAATFLEKAFVHYLESNKPSKAADHFHGLYAAKADLVGVALFDRIPSSKLQKTKMLTELMWRRREIENYLFFPDTLIAYAQNNSDLMRRLIADHIPPAVLRDASHTGEWWRNTKASDDFLDMLFEEYFKALAIPNNMRKTNYHVLANFVPLDQIDPEVIEKLDAIVTVAKTAKPRVD